MWRAACFCMDGRPIREIAGIVGTRHESVRRRVAHARRGRGGGAQRRSRAASPRAPPYTCTRPVHAAGHRHAQRPAQVRAQDRRAVVRPRPRARQEKVRHGDPVRDDRGQRARAGPCDHAPEDIQSRGGVPRARRAPAGGARAVRSSRLQVGAACHRSDGVPPRRTGSRARRPASRGTGRASRRAQAAPACPCSGPRGTGSAALGRPAGVWGERPTPPRSSSAAGASSGRSGRPAHTRPCGLPQVEKVLQVCRREPALHQEALCDFA